MTDARSRTQHWNTVYETRPETEVSWFESEPKTSLELIESVLPAGGSVLDVGGGASRLVDRLLERPGFDVTVLDVSEVALETVKTRLGASAARVRWIVGDLSTLTEVGTFDLWHDRAVFHFLTDPRDRQHYADLAALRVRPGGHLIVGTFAPDGPAKCSGLEVCRYDAAGLAQELGPGFELLRDRRARHETPTGKSQSFCFGLFRRLSP